MNIRQHLRTNIFFYLIGLFLVLEIFLSFNRFIVNNDYFVSYEGSCDPYAKSCFQVCEDDECTYSTKVNKYAPDVLAQCGKDIADCESASVCLLSDRECSITYCDEWIDEDCDSITEVVPIINEIDQTQETL